MAGGCTFFSSIDARVIILHVSLVTIVQAKNGAELKNGRAHAASRMSSPADGALRAIVTKHMRKAKHFTPCSVSHQVQDSSMHGPRRGEGGRERALPIGAITLILLPSPCVWEGGGDEARRVVTDQADTVAPSVKRLQVSGESHEG